MMEELSKNTLASLLVQSLMIPARYIRSNMKLDDLELKARFPAVDKAGRETGQLTVAQAGGYGQ